MFRVNNEKQMDGMTKPFDKKDLFSENLLSDVYRNKDMLMYVANKLKYLRKVTDAKNKDNNTIKEIIKGYEDKIEIEGKLSGSGWSKSEELVSSYNNEMLQSKSLEELVADAREIIHGFTLMKREN